ncbi:MAG: hypothetical protein R6U31_00375 [bacterium]
MDKVIITDRISRLPDISGFDRAYYIKNDPSSIIPPGFEKPDADYRIIEENAYRNAVSDINEFYSRNRELFPRKCMKNTLIKHMLHIYGYYYRQSRILFAARHSEGDISIVSNNIEQSEFPGMKIINDYSLFTLKNQLVMKLLRHIVSPLFHRTSNSIKNSILLKINSTAQFELFKYFFSSINCKDITVLISAPRILPRVKSFIEYLNDSGIDSTVAFNNSFFSTFSALKNLIPSVLTIGTYKEYLILHYLIEDYYMYTAYSELFIKNPHLKMTVMSDEFNASSDIIADICRTKNVPCFNFQHGGIYLADHNYGHFIVFSSWIKDYYSNITRTDPDNIYVLGHPARSNARFAETGNDTMKVLAMGQYIFGYMTAERKREMIDILRSIACQYDVETYFKDHPGSDDNIASSVLTADTVILDSQQIVDMSKYDIVISFYSTTMIESVLAGTPAIAINTDSVRGIPLLEHSGIRQVEDYVQLKDEIEMALENRSYLKTLWQEEFAQIHSYWNIVEKDRQIIEEKIKKIMQ